MSKLEVFEINENGAGWVALENSTKKLDIELAILTNAEISVKRLDVPEVRTCKVCEYAHEGLYCTNCFTGERVNVSTKPGRYQFAKVIKVTPVTCNK